MNKINFNNSQLKFIFFLLFFTLGVLPFFYSLIATNWDTKFLIDGAYRVSMGENPHSDFFTPFGQLIFFFTSIGLKLFPQTLMGFNIGLIFLVTILSLIIFRAISLSYKNYFIIFGIVFITLIFPKSLSYGFTWSHVGLYNRLGYGILIAVIITLIPYIFKKHLKTEPIILCSILTASLLYIKITYFVAVILFLPLFIIFNVRKLYLLIFLLNIVLFIVILGGVINWDFPSFYRDLKYLHQMSVNNTLYYRFSLPWMYINPFHITSWLIIMFCILKDEKDLKNKIKTIMIGLYCLGLDVFINITTNQAYENIMIIILSLYLIGFEYFNLNYKNFSPLNNDKVSKSSLPRLFLFCIVLYHLSLHAHLYSYNFFQQSLVVMKKISNFDFLKKYESDLYLKLPDKVKKIIKIDKKILVVGDNDDISFSLGLQSPRQPNLYWHKNQTFNTLSSKISKKFKPENVFKNVDIIILNYSKNHAINGDVIEFNLLYDSYLKNNFELFSNDGNYKVLIKSQNT